MFFIFKNKAFFSIIIASIISIIFYIFSNKNIPTSDNLHNMNINEQSADLTMRAENKLKADFKSIVIKGAGIAVFIYTIMYFIEDNEEEVYNYIDIGEPNF